MTAAEAATPAAKTPSPGQTLLEARRVGSVEGRFFIPDYQRGYRWSKLEVTALLDDIKDSFGTDYHLQPIVVKPKGDDRWELIDGQQRLTTLYLILRYIKTEIYPAAELRYSLEYETRLGSQEYLTNPTEDLRDENIDFFHIFNASVCIRGWFEAHGPDKPITALNFFKALSEAVYIIWYQAPVDMPSTDLFTRLNVGRIPLTDAELVKALLLSPREGQTGYGKELEMALRWDEVERQLQAPDVWAFVAGGREGATHIDLLLDAMADRTAGGPRTAEPPQFFTFETLRPEISAGRTTFWKSVLDMHSLVVGWYEDRDLYHWVGYLVAVGTPFGALVQLAQNLTKRAFVAALRGLIIDGLDLTESQVRGLTYKDWEKCRRVLLLMNIETVRAIKDASHRYSFTSDAAADWSLEHINAQRSKTLTKAADQRLWLEKHADMIKSLPGVDPTARESILTQVGTTLANLSTKSFAVLADEIEQLYQRVGPQGDDYKDSIANLALLGRGDNSALNNSVFEVKRQRVLELDRAGSYIPICTRNVFLKYYADPGDVQAHFWGPNDRERYLDQVIAKVTGYLRQEVAP